MNAEAGGPSEAIIVLGMHRSGTSALTGVLGQLGIYTGPLLIPGIENVNAKGFWEHPEIVDVHDRLLESLGSSWHDVKPMPAGWWLADNVAPYKAEIQAILKRDFLSQSRWVLKDPRICRLLPLWRDILTGLTIKARYIISLRHPLAVAASVQKRDGLPIEHGCLVWLAYMMDVERWTRTETRCFVFYDRLVNNWRKEMAHVADTLGLDLRLDDSAMLAKVDAFIDPLMRHHALTSADTVHPAVTCAQHCYASLDESDSEAGFGRAMDDVYPEYTRLAGLVGPWSDAINLLQRNEMHARAETAFHQQQFEKEIARIKSSVSWRITAPLRASWNLVLRPALEGLGLLRPLNPIHLPSCRIEKHRH